MLVLKIIISGSVNNVLFQVWSFSVQLGICVNVKCWNLIFLWKMMKPDVLNIWNIFTSAYDSIVLLKKENRLWFSEAILLLGRPHWFLPLHCGQVLQFILVHVVVGVPHHGLVDALQQPAALTQSHQQILLQRHGVTSSKHITWLTNLCTGWPCL